MRIDDPYTLVETLLKRGITDTHYHVGPELLPRRYNVATLAAVALEANATIVLKNHTYSTTALAALARAEYQVRFIGSIVLNRYVGGINPDAIHGAISGNRTNVSGQTEGAPDPPIVVWMPTVHARSHLTTLGHAFDPRWSGHCNTDVGSLAEEPIARPVDVFDESLHPLPETLEVLNLIARTGATLATGHLSSDEIMRLVPIALDCNIQRIVITHPHYPSVHLSDNQLRYLVRDERVFVEHCLAVHAIEGVPMSDFVESIKAVGPEKVAIASDFGQVCSEPFPEGTLKYATYLARLLTDAFSDEEIADMFTSNGLRALGLLHSS